MSANYAIYTSPNHQPIPDHLPTLIITPYGKPHQILYTYLHTNFNHENYLLTPSDQGDLCVAKLFPPRHSSNSDRLAIKCEASRNLRWSIKNEGIQNPVYKLTLPNPDNPQIEQPLFQVSKPNPNCPWWTLFYFTYAGHLIPPKRIEFGKILKPQPVNGKKPTGETKITVTGKTEEEKAVWKTLGEGNEDMVEWIIVCAALNVLDEEISKAAEAAGVQLAGRSNLNRAPSATNQQQPLPPPHQQQQAQATRAQDRKLHPTGSASRPQVVAPIRPAVYSNNPTGSGSNHHHPPGSHPIPQQARSNGLPPGAMNPQRSPSKQSHHAVHHPPHHPHHHPHPQQPHHYPPPTSSSKPPNGYAPPPASMPADVSRGLMNQQPGPKSRAEMFQASELPYARSATPTRQPAGYPQQVPMPASQPSIRTQPQPPNVRPPGAGVPVAPPHHHHPHPPNSTRPPQNYVPSNLQGRMIPPSESRAPIHPVNQYHVAPHAKQVR